MKRWLIFFVCVYFPLAGCKKENSSSSTSSSKAKNSTQQKTLSSINLDKIGDIYIYQRSVSAKLNLADSSNNSQNNNEIIVGSVAAALGGLVVLGLGGKAALEHFSANKSKVKEDLTHSLTSSQSRLSSRGSQNSQRRSSTQDTPQDIPFSSTGSSSPPNDISFSLSRSHLGGSGGAIEVHFSNDSSIPPQTLNRTSDSLFSFDAHDSQTSFASPFPNLRESHVVVYSGFPFEVSVVDSSVERTSVLLHPINPEIDRAFVEAMEAFNRKDYSQYLKLLEYAADNGHGEAAFKYALERSRVEDWGQYVHYLRLAKEAGDSTAEIIYAEEQYDGRMSKYGIPTNQSEAWSTLNKLSQSGDPNISELAKITLEVRPRPRPK